MNNYQKPEEKDNKHYIFKMIIILIIIILMLLTSCSCTSKLWGKIGDFFDNDGEVIIDPGTDDADIIKNKELIFDKNKHTISLSDNKYKLAYSYKNIIPENLKCSTSDANIATCIVENGYVVIYPKKVGEITVFLQTEVNDKIYEATADITIIASKKYIKLSSKKGTIDLKIGNTKKFSYYLVNLDGEITIKSSDEKVATAVIKNGVVIITAHKTGSASITLSLEYNGKIYEASYSIKVVDTTNDNNPDKPEDNKKDYYLLDLIISNGELNPTFNTNTFKYSVNLESQIDKISIYPEISKDANVTYKIGDKEVKSLEDLNIPFGDTLVTIIVSTKNGEQPYEVNIHRDKPSSKDFYVNPEKTEYNMLLTDKIDSKTIILNTNLFVGNITIKKIDGGLRLVSSKDETLFIDIISNSEEIKSLEYTGELTGPISLPILIKALKVGTANIEVKLNAYGEVIDTKNITINIVNKYILKLSANGGLFNDVEKEYEFILGAEDFVDLSIYDKPYKELKDNHCKIYKFIGYSETPDGEVKYDGNGIIYGKDLSENLTLYAIYSSEIYDKNQELTKRIRLTDIPLFHNKEYFEKYGKDKVIYPGAHGSYIAYITNESNYDITIKKIILEEDTICSGVGCLNMGYIVKHAAGPFYYMGSYETNTDKYEILNNASTKSTNYTKKELDMRNNTITIASGKTKDISFFWKWVDDDSVDASIGNIAADKNLNDLYKVYITFEYTTNEDKCK